MDQKDFIKTLNYYFVTFEEISVNVVYRKEKKDMYFTWFSPTCDFQRIVIEVQP